MRIYLDTNMVWGWFKRAIESRRKGIPLKIPSIMRFVASRNELELFTSIITKIEIFRFLKSEWNCSEKESEEIWESFIDLFRVSYFDVKEVDFNELLRIVSEISTKKKTLVNLIHLQIAKRNGFRFLTGEEKLKKKYEKYYDNILTYKDLRKLFA